MVRILRLLTVLFLVQGVFTASDFSVETSHLSTWNQSDWSLTTNTYAPGQYQSRLSLANGYVGASLAAAGPFFELDVNQTDLKNGTQPTNDWPLFSPRLSFTTISGYYDIQTNGSGTNYPWLNQYGWESFISGIPHATAIIFAFGDNYLDATASNTTISDFKSTISFKSGVANWEYTWKPERFPSFNVSYTIIFSRLRPNVIAVKASIIASQDILGTVTDLFDGRSAVRSHLGSKGLDSNSTSMFISTHPNGLPQVTGWLVSTADFDNGFTNISSRAAAIGKYASSNDTTIGQSFAINLKAGYEATFYKYVGVASSDKFADPDLIARKASADARQSGWDSLVVEHVEAWQQLLTDATVDDFRNPVTGALPEDESVQILHIASVANAFYLLQNLQPDGSGLNDNSIAVGGLASDSYGGLVFWDADYWMAPGLNLAFPQYSKQISNLRVQQHPQALANAQFNGYPDGSSLYSWTSGRYGNCTGTGPCVDYEYHLNYDIAFNLIQQFNITQNHTWFDDGPRQIVESTAVMTGQLLMYNQTTRTYWLKNATDPDEYANNVDNAAFTIASAASLLRLANNLRVEQGSTANLTWAEQAININLPRAPSNITLEFETMNNSVVVKQADVVLLTYPLGYSQDYTAADKLKDLDYYSNKQSSDGPAMTYSVFAVGANALSASGCAAYTYTLNGFLPYLRAPWFQFSEQADDDVLKNGGTNPAFPFLTGHGGANQVVPFGYLGLRTDQDVLYIDPSLPPQIANVKVRNFYFGGAGISAKMNQTHTTITRFDTSKVSAVTDVHANTTLPIIVGKPNANLSDQTRRYIPINSTIVISNRRYFSTLSYPKNLLQCLPVSSPNPYSPGQFPLAAVDGATATRWQPTTNTSSVLIVNMTSVPPSRVSGFYFNWGLRPPINVKIYIGNETGTIASSSYSGPIHDQASGIIGQATKIELDQIVISKPYNITVETAMKGTVDEIVPVLGNETTVKIANADGIWSGGFVALVIEGCWESDGMGATVGEFVMIGE